MEIFDTPNPNALKLLFNHTLEIGQSITTDDEVEDILIQNLLEVEGIENIFTGPGFITLTKSSQSEWGLIKDKVIQIFDKLG